MEATSFAVGLADSPVIKEYFVLSDELKARSPEVRAGFNYWRSKCGDGRLPGRVDIDPLDFFRILPNTMLVDVCGPTRNRRFRFRVMGQVHVDVAGGNYTGFSMDEVREIRDDQGYVMECYDAVVERRQPHFWERHFIDPAKGWMEYERVVLPLAGNGRDVDMLMSFATVVGSIAND